MNPQQHELLVRIDERVEGITARLNHLPCEIESEKYSALETEQVRLSERMKNMVKVVWTLFAASVLANLFAVLKGNQP